jgi:2-succinyl-5-enolpyruvyl-6-hydroxy-3-cyclohexene-1-carboxylate synthase
MNPTITTPKFDLLAQLAQICVEKGLQQVVISPGSRSAPLTIAFARQAGLQCRVVLDERAAAFVALGLAQQTGRPVGLICTSGTATLNYGPAVAEAFYQEIPLLLFTADRPAEWLDQADGQTIHQTGLYGPHCRGSFSLRPDDGHPDAIWQAQRLLSEAINRSMWPTPGPVQINVPLREPLYPPPGQPHQSLSRPKIIHQPHPEGGLSEESWLHLQTRWQQAERKLVIAGLHPANPALATALAALQADPSVAVIADITANLPAPGLRLPHSDMVLSSKVPETIAALKPDLVVSFGGPVVSKALKLFLRKQRPAEHWHIRPDGQAIDTFQALTQVIAVYPAYFFETLARRQAGSPAAATPESYQGHWLALEERAQQALSHFLAEAPFGEFGAVDQVLRALPAHSNLQLGNSMPIRYANYLGLKAEPVDIRVNSNRGSSGIDGSLSTAVGAALAGARLTTLICGDLAFFYDRNGLWHRHVPPNLRVVILNNGGGGIFKLIDGPANLPAAELEQFFFTPQPLTARNTAADHHCAYFPCGNAASLSQVLPDFFAPQSRAAILEIETDSEVNTRLFQQFKAVMAELKV